MEYEALRWAGWRAFCDGGAQASLELKHAFFTAVPAITLILVSPIYLYRSDKGTVNECTSVFLYAKLLAVSILLGADYATVIFWVPSSAYRTLLLAGPSCLSFLATFSVAGVSVSRHKCAIHTPTFVSLYWLGTAALDVVKIHYYLFEPGMGLIVLISSVSAALRGLLAVLEGRSKRATDPNTSETDDWSPNVAMSRLTSLVRDSVAFGFKNMESLDGHPQLGADFSSECLAVEVASSWAKVNRSSPYYLAKACLLTFYIPLLKVILSQICFLAFTASQALLLQRVLTRINEQGQSLSFIYQLDMIELCLFVFGGIAISRAVYNYNHNRLATLLRGALISQLFNKLVTIDCAKTKRPPTLTLLTNDVDRVVAGLPEIYTLWLVPIQLVLGLYILKQRVGSAFWAIFVPMIISSLSSTVCGKLIVPVQFAWDKTAEHCVLKTSAALSQMKSIKLMGLERVVAFSIHSLRKLDVQGYLRMRRIWSIITVTAVFTNATTGVFVITGAYIWTTFGADLTVVSALTTLALVALVADGVQSTFSVMPRLGRIAPSFLRIQEFLLLPEIQHGYSHSLHSTSESLHPSSTNQQVALPGRIRPSQPGTSLALVLSNTHLTSQYDNRSVLRNLNITIDSSTFTMLFGPSGSGKSTLLRAILGEVQASNGILYVGSGLVAYCGQRPWIENASIRSNIIGKTQFQPIWFETVLRICLLDQDIQLLENEDLYLAGYNGCRLNAGQRHRVALARAIYSRAHILVLDDFFSALDLATRTRIFMNLFGIRGFLKNRNFTVFLASSLVEHQRSADNILLFDGEGGISLHRKAEKINLRRDYTRKLTWKGFHGRRHEARAALPPTTAEQRQQQNYYGQQSRNLSLYLFFIESAQPLRFFAWAASLVAVAVLEGAPDIFLSLYLDSCGDKFWFFVYYSAIGLSSSLVCGFMFWLFYAKVLPGFSENIHTSFLDTITHATLPNFSPDHLGTMAEIFSNDMKFLVVDFSATLLMHVYKNGLVIRYAAIIAYGIHNASMLTALTIFVLIVFLQHHFAKASRQLQQLDIQARTPLATFFAETASGLDHIRGFRRQSARLRSSHELLDKAQKPFHYILSLQSWLALVWDIISAALAITTVAVALYSQNATPAAVGLSLFTLPDFARGVATTTELSATLEGAWGARERLRKFVDTTPVEADSDQRSCHMSSDWPERGMIVLRQATARYSLMGGQPAISSVTLEIEGGTRFGLFGPSGSGKSTFILALLNFLPYSGTVEIDGIDISTISRRRLRTKVVTTLGHDPVHLEGTVRDNLLPYEGQQDQETMTEDAMHDVLEKLGLLEAIKGKGGLETPLEDVELAGSQLQVLCIARAILHHRYTRSKVILIDDATSNMDPDRGLEIQKVMKEAFAGCTVIMTAQKRESLYECDTMVQLHDGMVC